MAPDMAASISFEEVTEAQLVWDRGQFDVYKDPGQPVTWSTPAGKRAVLQLGEWLYLIGRGGSGH